jgi:hypothetical protein
VSSLFVEPPVQATNEYGQKLGKKGTLARETPWIIKKLQESKKEERVGNLPSAGGGQELTEIPGVNVDNNKLFSGTRRGRVPEFCLLRGCAARLFSPA